MICTIYNEKQLLLNYCLKCDDFLGEYVSAFDNVFCSQNNSFDDWSSLGFEQRFKVLSMFYNEITYILRKEFSKLSRYPGKNKNRVEKIEDGLFEYRIDNPNYRLYFMRDKEKLIVLMGILKKSNCIAKKVKEKLKNLRKYPYYSK